MMGKPSTCRLLKRMKGVIPCLRDGTLPLNWDFLQWGEREEAVVLPILPVDGVVEGAEGVPLVQDLPQRQIAFHSTAVP